MKTAQTIAAQMAEKDSDDSPKKHKRGTHPKSLANLVAPWTSETRPSTGGRRKDAAADIARKVFENNEVEIYKAHAAKLLQGDAYAFSVLADRAFGKLKQTQVHVGDEDGGPINASLTVKFVKPDEKVTE